LQKPKTRGDSFPKVFLGGLPSNITETDLRMFFGRYGKVMEVVIMYDQEKKKSRGFGFLSFEDDASVDRVTTEHYITLNGKQVEIKKAEPRDGSSNHKMNQDPNQSAGSHWGPPGPVGMMQGPNGQMNAPPMNMMGSMAAPNMMGGYQGWGASAAAAQQQQNYGYGNPNPGYNQGWGHQPPQPQGPPPHQWGNYNAGTPQTQQYGSYGEIFFSHLETEIIQEFPFLDMYNSSTGGPAASSGGGANWNSWGLTNSGSAGSSEYCRFIFFNFQGNFRARADEK
jgi:RNA-binding protein Musashi